MLLNSVCNYIKRWCLSFKRPKYEPCTVYWIDNAIFCLEENLFDFIGEMIDRAIEKTGEYFISKECNGEVGLLPPTSVTVIDIIKRYDYNHSTDYSSKAREGKATLAYIKDGNGIIITTAIVGADNGFDSRISESFKRDNIYATRIKD